MRTYSQTVEHVTLVSSSAKIGPTPKHHEFESKNFKPFFFIKKKKKNGKKGNISRKLDDKIESTISNHRQFGFTYKF